MKNITQKLFMGIFVGILAFVFNQAQAEVPVQWQYIYAYSKRTFVSSTGDESTDNPREWWDPWTVQGNNVLVFRSIQISRYANGAALTGRRSYYKAQREVYYDKTTRQFSGTLTETITPYPTGSTYTQTSSTTSQDDWPSAFGQRCEPGINTDCTDTFVRIRYTNNSSNYAVINVSAVANHLFTTNPSYGGSPIVSGREYSIDTFGMNPATVLDRSYYRSSGITSVQPILWGFSNISYGLTK